MSYTYEGQTVLAVRCEKTDEGCVPQVVLDDGATAQRRLLWAGQPVADPLDAARIAGDRLAQCMAALLRSNLVDVGTMGGPTVFIEGAPR